MTAATSIAEALEKGAAKLDETLPDWWTMVDLEKLDINNVYNCVLGQLAGPLQAYGYEGWTPYFSAFKHLFPTCPSAYGQTAIDHGFAPGFYEPTPGVTQYSSAVQLTEAWRKLIEERRALAEL